MPINYKDPEYKRLTDKALFTVKQDDDGYSIWYTADEAYGWPLPNLRAVQGLPDEETANVILMRMRQMDIDMVAAGLLQFQPNVDKEAEAKEPDVKESEQKKPEKR